jgi:hypothetical protein
MKSIVIAVAVLFASNAFANSTPPKPAPIYNTNKNSNTNLNINGNKNVNNNTATGGQGGAGGAGGQGGAGGVGIGGSATATSGINAPITVGGATVDVEASKLAYAPNVYAPTTTDCRNGVGGSAGVFGFSGGISTSVEDERCAIQELSRHFMVVMGNRAAAEQVLCLDDRARKTLEAVGVKCLIKKDEPVQQEKVTP